MSKKELRHKVELILDAHEKMADLFKDALATVQKGEHHKRIADIVREILGWMNQ